MIAVVIRLLSGLDHFTLDFKSIDYALRCKSNMSCRRGKDEGGGASFAEELYVKGIEHWSTPGRSFGIA